MSDMPAVVGIECSPTVGALGKKVAKAQTEMKHPVKSRTIAIPGRDEYSYAELHEVIDESRALAKVGVAVLQLPEARGATVKVTTMLIDGESGEWLRCALHMTAKSSDPQQIGATLTYCRRYALQSIINVGAEADLDGLTADAVAPKAVTGQVTPPKPKPAPVPVTRGESATSEIFTITDIGTKDGTKDNKPWRKFTVTFDDDRRASTFDAKLGDLAQVCHADQLPVRRVLREAKDPKWLPDLVALEVVEDANALELDAAGAEADDIPF